mgnify:CR=1 FL=1
MTTFAQYQYIKRAGLIFELLNCVNNSKDPIISSNSP